MRRKKQRMYVYTCNSIVYSIFSRIVSGFSVYFQPLSFCMILLFFFIFTIFFQSNLICVVYKCSAFSCKRQYWGSHVVFQFTCIFHFSACARASVSIFSFFLLTYLKKRNNITERYFKYFRILLLRRFRRALPA